MAWYAYIDLAVRTRLPHTNVIRLRRYHQKELLGRHLT